MSTQTLLFLALFALGTVICTLKAQGELGVTNTIWVGKRRSIHSIQSFNVAYFVNKDLNLQATKLFIVTSATKGGGYHPLRFSVRFKI